MKLFIARKTTVFDFIPNPSFLFSGAPNRDGSISSYARTPAYSGSQTPLYRDTGNKTPMHDSGSRTPLHSYGSMTPIHDGSRTPNAHSEWDPAVPNTYPSPGYNPSTPGYQMNGPFTPQTPGTMYENNYSPGYQSEYPNVF